MKQTPQIVMIFTTGLLLTSGCASCAVRQTSHSQARFYPGMRDDAHMIVEPSEVTWAAPTKTERVIFGAVDIVPSTVVDTLCLPWELAVPRRTN